MRQCLFLFLFCSLFVCCKKSGTQKVITPPPNDSTPVLAIRGADLSFLPAIEEAGTQFYDSTGPKPCLAIFKEYGCNLVRVRLWYNPSDPHSGLDEVLNFCQQISTEGMKILLDFHYSDTWADPGHQSPPAAWASLPLAILQDSVEMYTSRVIGLLKAQNTLPAIVQIGNEINNGILWNVGKISGSTDPNWANFAALVKSGIAGVKDVDIDNSIAIMLHYAEVDGAPQFFASMQQQNVPFDIIGLSYYPWWAEQDLSYIQSEVSSIASTFNKKIMIVETAYPWTLQWNDNTANEVGEASQLIPGYPATPQGQLQYLQQIKTILLNVPGGLGMGFCYWEPDWVAYLGPTATNGSAGENLTLFDFNNKVLPGITIYQP